MIALRPHQPADLDQLAALWFHSASLPGVFPRDIPPIAALRARMDDELASGWELTVATLDGAIAGFLAIRTETAVVEQLFLHPDALGRGIGRQLLDRAKAAMPDGFTLHTAMTNTGGRAFYQRCDMVPVREEIHPRWGHEIIWYASRDGGAHG